MQNMSESARKALEMFPLPEALIETVRYGEGHINETYRVTCGCGDETPVRFILQGLSPAAFPCPEKLMENFVGITTHLRKKIIENGGDPLRETLSVVKTKTGDDYYTDEAGKVWRMMPFIEDTICLQSATPELFESSARAFGRFQYLLQDYPVETLHETIKDFHNTEDRLKKFEAALMEDALSRAAGVAQEIRFVLDRKDLCSVAMQAWREGKLPLRVTHNDTKLNNVLLDKQTGEGICVVDLDTTMPGLSIYDFGDSIRFGANHCREDEPDLSKVAFDMDLFEVYTRGFLQGTRGALIHAELEYLPWGAVLMTFECGMRFLTDYLQGDTYFHVSFPEQNLYRCRTQFKLVQDMQQQFTAMQAIVRKYA